MKILELVGFDGVDGRGVFAFEERRRTDLKRNFIQNKNILSVFITNSDEAFCH